jgi:hypothetical protein
LASAGKIISILDKKSLFGNLGAKMSYKMFRMEVKTCGSNYVLKKEWSLLQILSKCMHLSGRIEEKEDKEYPTPASKDHISH